MRWLLRPEARPCDLRMSEDGGGAYSYLAQKLWSARGPVSEAEAAEKPERASWCGAVMVGHLSEGAIAVRRRLRAGGLGWRWALGLWGWRRERGAGGDGERTREGKIRGGTVG